MLNYVFCATEYDWYLFMYRDIIYKDNVMYFRSIYDMLLPSEKMMYDRVEKKNEIYVNALKRIKFANHNDICFIHFSRFLREIRNGLVEAEKLVFKNSKQVHYFTDVIHLTNGNMKLLYKKMDAIGVYDENVAKMHNIHFWPHSFPSVQIDLTEIYYDLCFVGMGMGRTHKIIEIAQKCACSGVRIAFYLMNPDYRINELIPGLKIIDSPIPYIKSLEIVKKSRCILELERDNGYHACSLRVLEAVAFNKKILTDNKRVYLMPWCNNKKQYIQCFDKIRDIDVDFIKTDDKVDFEYTGEYSASHFLDRIENAVKTF